MDSEQKLARMNKMVIMILLGTFTLVELLYLAPEYAWGIGQVRTLMAMIFT